MARGKRMNARKDKAFFKKNASRVHKLNLPGMQNRRGGTCL